MAKLVSVFISKRHRRQIGIGIWIVSFAIVLLAATTYTMHRSVETMRMEANSSAEHFIRLRANLISTFAAMHQVVTAEPCTAPFNEQLRKIAYLPDGLNEFLYAPGASVQCSVNVMRFDEPVELGAPDIPWQSPEGFAFWIDRDLGFLGLDGLVGTVALQEPFATIVPPQQIDLTAPDWMAMEVVLVARDGQWWHRLGTEDLYPDALEATLAGGFLPIAGGALHVLTCDEQGMHCIAARAYLADIMARERVGIVLALICAVLIASLITLQVGLLIERYWSFEQRFRRHLDAGSIVCAYQPVMDLDSGEITGCEVLARWRDLDDSIVFPDQFIAIVERHGMTQMFTELVADRAFAELCAHVPEGVKLQVNFNIFPRDLDSTVLLRIFGRFTARFGTVLEIIESDEFPKSAQHEIEALRRAGIKTYIDDFGTGYSNMQNLAALSVDGVKLDRSFAMAPDESMMAQMLTHAIAMIRSTGRLMVIEGVETRERLQFLRDMGTRIEFVQGYFISRPLAIEPFAAFLATGGAPDAQPETGATRAA